MTFLRCVAGDPHDAKDAGGLRAVLKSAGVSHLAVIEVTLRASTEEGLEGLDLTTAPLEEIAPRVVTATHTWQESTAQGEGRDDIAGAIGSLEEAARELVARRLGEALMRLDEETRARAIAAAYATDAGGKPMAGMLDVLARMKPAALARLLKLSAGMAGLPVHELTAGLKLPPEALKALMLLIAPSAQSETARGVPPEADAREIASEVAEENEGESARPRASDRPQLRGARGGQGSHHDGADRDATGTPRTRSARSATRSRRPCARARTPRCARRSRTSPRSPVTSRCLSLPRGRASPWLTPTCSHACISSLSTGADPDLVAAILSAAGPVGAESFIGFYLGADAMLRPRLQQVLRAMGDVVTAAASRRIRGADSKTAKELIGVLVSIGDKRAVPVLRQAMEHLDFDVRRACLAALADMGGNEAERLLVEALNHWDPETRRVAAHEIGRARATSAIPAMLKILQGYYLFERNYGLKKELIESLEALGSPAAVPTLRRMAGRRFVLGRKNRELQFLARRALDGLTKAAD